MALLSCLLLPAPSLGLVLAKDGCNLPSGRSEPALHHFVLPVVLLLGTIEFFVLRFIWRRWFSLAANRKKSRGQPGILVISALIRPAVALFAIGSRRLVKGTGKDPRERLLRVKPVTQADVVHAFVRFTQVARRQ
jgi:hypothetical protein